jgi:hypothetical protein
MNRRTLRRIALCLIGILGFAQGAVALAACAIERGSMNMVQSAESAEPCTMQEQPAGAAAHDNLCFAHCTADLSAPGSPAVLVRGPADAAVLHVVAFRPPSLQIAAFEVPPPRGVPPRILLHSFLI